MLFLNTSLSLTSFKLSRYKPYINYTWVERPNGQVQNIGSSGQDLELFSGNPLDFQATQGIQVNKSFTLSGNAISLFLGFDTDSIAITQTLAEFDNLKVSIVNAILRVTINAVNHDVATLVTNTYYQTEIVINSNNLTVKLNGTQTYSASCTALNTTILKSLGANDGLASGRFDGQFDYFIVYNGLTTFSLPNQFFKDMSTDVNTLFCTDFRGNAGYIADSKNVSVGSELIGGNTYSIKAGAPTITDMGDYILIEGKTTTDYVEVIGSQRPYIEANSTTLWSFEIDNTIGSAYVRAYQGDAYKTISTYGGAGYEKGTSIISNTNGIGGALIFVQPTTAPYAIKVYNISAKQLLAVYPIINYSATQRTNFTQVNKGLQDLTRSFNSNGFFLSLRDFPKNNGVGTADTGWIPNLNSDFTIEWIQHKLNYNWAQNTGKSYFVGGSWVYNNNDFYFGESSLGEFTIKIGSNSVSIGNDFEPMVADKKYLITCSFVASSKILTMTINNGLFIKSGSITTYISSGKSVYLFNQHNQYIININPLTTELRLFKVHNKALTQAEITKNYNDYITQGLLS